jgi:hypothetical protein
VRFHEHFEPPAPPPIRIKPTYEDCVDKRLRLMNLKDSADALLPEYMVLLTDEPQQAFYRGRVCNIFSLGSIGKGATMCLMHFEYLHSVADHIQLRWAMADYYHRLLDLGVIDGNAVKPVADEEYDA